MRESNRVSFPTQDGGLIYADMYGSGHRALVLAHGGRFKKESWSKQASELASGEFHASRSLTRAPKEILR
jgi:hypothetical protein